MGQQPSLSITYEVQMNNGSVSHSSLTVNPSITITELVGRLICDAGLEHRLLDFTVFIDDKNAYKMTDTNLTDAGVTEESKIVIKEYSVDEIRERKEMMDILHRVLTKR